jgi:hypothetical protein
VPLLDGRCTPDYLFIRQKAAFGAFEEYRNFHIHGGGRRLRRARILSLISPHRALTNDSNVDEKARLRP